jgi:transcriptional regulator GlxA family with amidase domain
MTASSARNPPASVYIMAFDRCDELDVVGPAAVLQTANRYLGDATRTPPGKPFTLRIVSVDGAGAVSYDGPDGKHWFVTGIHGLTLGTEPWDGNELPDILIVAGGDVADDAGITRQQNNPAFTDVIAAQNARGGQVVSVCTGAFGLVGASIAQGRRMTTHPGLINELEAAGVRVLNPDWEARVVDDGDIISCGGVTSGIDEALYLVQAFWPGDPQLQSDVRNFVDFHYRSPVATAHPGSAR